MTDATILIAERRAKSGCAPAYEAVVGGMFTAARENAPGFAGAELHPPLTPEGLYRVEMRFTSPQALTAWKASDTRRQWQDRIDSVAEGEPEFRFLSGLEAWFTGPEVGRPPKRWKMAVVTWLGILPTAGVVLWFVAPLLIAVGMEGNGWFVPRTALSTMLITVLMTWLVMPNLTKLFRGWIVR